MRRNLTYANVAATLALVFSMTGGAIAASHYLITSTSQIKPSVIAKLRGKPGPQGQPSQAYTLPGGPLTVQIVGPKGAPGAAGQPGQRGEVGVEGRQGSEVRFAHICNALAEVILDLEHANAELRAHLPSPVGPTGLIDRQEAELQSKEITLAAVSQTRAQSNC